MIIGLKEYNNEMCNVRHYKNIEGLKAEISEEDYYYLLEVLPPIYTKKGFYVGEPISHIEKGILYDFVYKENNNVFVISKNIFEDFPTKKERFERGIY